MSLQQRIANRDAAVGIVGLGYVGLRLAVSLAHAGYAVHGFDLDAARVASLSGGESYIAGVSDEEIRSMMAQGRLWAHGDMAQLTACEVFVICVPTPLDRHKQPDLRHVEQACADIAAHIRADSLVILESTTYPGTTEELVRPALERSGLRCGADIALAFSPERVDPGNPQYGLSNTPKVVGGLTGRCTELAALLYRTGLGCAVHPVSSPRTAEMSKLLENTYRAVNLGLVNEFALLAHEMGIDIWEVVEAAKTKPFGFQAFYPGPGVGGHCIPLDPYYLAWRARAYDMRATLIEAAGDVLESMPYRVADRIAELLGDAGLPVKGANILLVGVAYKPDIDDCRESPSLKLMEILAKRGAAVAYHDPHVPHCACGGSRMKSVALAPDSVVNFDLVAVMTAHSAVDFAMLARHARLLLDTRNALREAVRPGARIQRL